MQPISKTVQIRVVNRKAFLLIVRLYTVCGGNNRSNQKGLVDINSTTNWINNFQTIFLPVKNARKKTVTESSHKLTGVKKILSVRAQRQHLFVLEKMILTLINILFSARSTLTTPPTVRCSVSSSSKQLYNKNRRCLALFNYYLC